MTRAPRILLIHWHAGEAAERADRLRRAGYEAQPRWDLDGPRMKPILNRPPDAVVIDLARRPAQGLAVATLLRQRKATRAVPLVFVVGDDDTTQRVREALPDAVYATWRGVRGALRRALAAPPARPVVPGTMDGYAGTPLPRKLGITRGRSVALVNAPDGFERGLGDLPAGVTVRRSARGVADVVMLFAATRAELGRRFPAASRAVAEGGSIWIAWPKQASGLASDLTQPLVRRFGLDAGFVDYKICAIDSTWSGLRFARRKPEGTRS